MYASNPPSLQNVAHVTVSDWLPPKTRGEKHESQAVYGCHLYYAHFGWCSVRFTRFFLCGQLRSKHFQFNLNTFDRVVSKLASCCTRDFANLTHILLGVITTTRTKERMKGKEKRRRKRKGRKKKWTVRERERKKEPSYFVRENISEWIIVGLLLLMCYTCPLHSLFNRLVGWLIIHNWPS